MKTVWRKIFADVRARRGRTVLVALSIMIGVFGVSVTVGVGDIIGGQLREDLQPDQLPMNIVDLSLPEETTSLADNRAYLLNLLNQTQAEIAMGQVFAPVDWRTAGTDHPFTDGLIITYTEPLERLPLKPITKVFEGDWPQPGRQQIAIERRFADEFGVGVGDKLVFADQPDPAPEWEVTGVLYAPYAATETDDPQTIIFAQYEDAQQIAGFGGLSEIDLRYGDFITARGDETAVLRFVSEQTPYVVDGTFLDDPDNSLKMQEVNDVVGLMNMLGLIAMVVSGFLVINVINTIVMEQRRQVGIMKALGATRFRIFLIYAGMALVYGAIGTILGILLSLPLVAYLAKGIARMSETYIDGFQISDKGIGIAVLMGLLVPVLITLIPVLLGTRVTILEALTDLGIASNWGKGRLARWIGGLPVPINVRQALGNVAQKRGRLALTIITLALAAGSFMGVTAAFSSVDTLVETIFAQFDYDVVIFPRDARTLPDIETALQAGNIAYDRIGPAFGVSVGLEGYESPESSVGSNQIEAIGVDPANPSRRLDLRDGDGWRTDVDCRTQLQTPECMSVILSYTVADMLGKKAGNTVMISGSGENYPFLVAGVDNIPLDSIYFRWDVLATLAGYVDEQSNPLPNAFFVKLAGGNLSADAVDKQIGQIDRVLLANGIEAEYENQPQNEADQQDFLDVFAALFNLTSGVLAGVGGIGLMAVLSMAVFERQKEIGVMRSIGGGSGAVITQFLTEGIVVGIIAWVIGLPISFVLAPMLIDALPASTTIDFSYPPTVIVIGLIGVVVFATIASLWPSISAARKTVSDILRYQ